MIQKKSDDAVSPVIGVMLMLVITVVVAGVIAAFGTGMVGETESAPNVVLDVQILSNFNALAMNPDDMYPDGSEDEDNENYIKGSLDGPDFQIRHVSGDPLDTGDIEIQIAWTEKDGTFHDSTYSAAEYKKNNPEGQLPAAGTTGYIRMQPMYVKTTVQGTGYTYGSDQGTLNYYFGDAVLTPGMRLTASTDMLKGSYKCAGSIFMDIIFNDGEILTTDVETDPGIMKYMPPGTPVEITILHIPSNTVIYEKEVIVQ